MDFIDKILCEAVGSKWINIYDDNFKYEPNILMKLCELQQKRMSRTKKDSI